MKRSRDTALLLPEPGACDWAERLVPDMQEAIRRLLDLPSALMLALTCRAEYAERRVRGLTAEYMAARLHTENMAFYDRINLLVDWRERHLVIHCLAYGHGALLPWAFRHDTSPVFYSGYASEHSKRLGCNWTDVFAELVVRDAAWDAFAMCDRVSPVLLPGMLRHMVWVQAVDKPEPEPGATIMWRALQRAMGPRLHDAVIKMGTQSGARAPAQRLVFVRWYYRHVVRRAEAARFLGAWANALLCTGDFPAFIQEVVPLCLGPIIHDLAPTAIPIGLNVGAADHVAAGLAWLLAETPPHDHAGVRDALVAQGTAGWIPALLGNSYMADATVNKHADRLVAKWGLDMGAAWSLDAWLSEFLGAEDEDRVGGTARPRLDWLRAHGASVILATPDEAYTAVTNLLEENLDADSTHSNMVETLWPWLRAHGGPHIWRATVRAVAMMPNLPSSAFNVIWRTFTTPEEHDMLLDAVSHRTSDPSIGPVF